MTCKRVCDMVGGANGHGMDEWNKDVNDMKHVCVAHVTRKEHVPKIQHITNHTQQKRGGKICHLSGDKCQVVLWAMKDDGNAVN